MLAAIAALTVLSGTVQLLAPERVLGWVGGTGTEPAAHYYFAIVGMFMVLYGGVLLHALLRPEPPPVVVLWAGLQKFGAFVVITLGVVQGVFGQLALLVGGFDLLTAVLLALYLVRLERAPAAAGRAVPVLAE